MIGARVRMIDEYFKGRTGKIIGMEDPGTVWMTEIKETNTTEFLVGCERPNQSAILIETALYSVELDISESDCEGHVIDRQAVFCNGECVSPFHRMIDFLPPDSIELI